MQQGTIIFGAILGMNHVKWAANANRQAGEMLSMYVCPATDGGTLDAEPITISVPSENVPSALMKLQTLKQFDSVMVSVQPLPARPGERQVRFNYRGFFDFPKK